MWDVPRRIGRELLALIAIQRCFRDLDQKSYVGRYRRPVLVVIKASPDNGKVRFRFVEVGDAHRLLKPPEPSRRQESSQQVEGLTGRPTMRRILWHLFHHVSVDKLDPFILERARGDDPFVLVNVDAV